MSRARLILFTLLAVSVVSGDTTASTLADEFVIEDKGLATEEKVEGTSGVSALEFQLGTTKVTLECKKSTLTGSLEEAGKSHGEIAFKECVVKGAEKCAVKEPVEFKFKDQLVKEPVEDELNPKEGTTFSEITFQGAECPATLKGTKKLTGTQVCELPKAAEELTEHEMTCKPSGSKLKVAEQEAKLTVTETVKLVSSKKWGPAAAEFRSQNKEAKGKGEDSETTLEAGGATVRCQAFSESASKVTWTIEREGKATTRGPSLVLNIEKWGECTLTSSEIKEEKAEPSACELELKTKVEEETKATGKVLTTTCTIKASSCEIKVEAKENEKLSSISLYPSGEKSETSINELAVTNVATSTKGSCAGIKATKEGKLRGFEELKLVQQPELAQFIIEARPNRLGLGQGQPRTSTVTVARIRGAAGAPASWQRGGATQSFTLQGFAGAGGCETKSYSVGGMPCEFTVTYVGPAGNFLIGPRGATGPAAAAEIIGT